VFRDVAIPEQSLITKANIYLTSYNTSIPSPLITDIHLSNEDNPSPPTDKFDLDSRPLSSQVNWVIHQPWFDNVTYKSPDLKVLIQEIVDRAGFAEGNNVMAMIKDNTTIDPEEQARFIIYDRNTEYSDSNQWVYKWGDYLYVGNFDTGLDRYSITPEGQIVFVDTQDVTAGIYAQQWLQGDHLFVAQDIGGINSYNVVGSNFYWVDQNLASERQTGCWGDGEYIYTSTHTGTYKGLNTYSVINGVLTRKYNKSLSDVGYLSGDSNFLFMGGRDGLSIYALSGAGALTLVDNHYTGTGFYWGIIRIGDYIYVGCTSDSGGNGSGIRIYSIDGGGNITFQEHYRFEESWYQHPYYDGTYLYWSGRDECINISTIGVGGTLNYVDSINDTDRPVDAWSMSGDSNFLYTGSFHSGEGIVSWAPPPEPDVYAKWWSAIEHLGGIEKACLRVHWRQAERIQTPVITPAEEFQLDVPFDCTISTYPTDALIYYTNNGSDPDENDTLYTGPFTIESPQTIKAKAYKQYWIPSYIAQKDYEVLWPGVGDHLALGGEAMDTDHVMRVVGDYVYFCVFLWTRVSTNYQKGVTVIIYDKVNDSVTQEVLDESGTGMFAASTIMDMLVEDDGTIHILYSTRYVASISFHDVYYATNESGSWVITNIEDQEWVTNYGYIDMDSNGKIHCFYNVKSGTRVGPMHTTNQSGSWQSEQIDTDIQISSVRGCIDNNDDFTIIYGADQGSSYPPVGHVAEGSWGSWNITELSGVSDAGEFGYNQHAFYDEVVDKVYIVNFSRALLPKVILELTKVSGVWTPSVLDYPDPELDIISLAGAQRDVNGDYHFAMENQGGYDRGIYYVSNLGGSWQYLFTKSENSFGDGQQASHGGVNYDISTEEVWMTYRIAPVQPPLTIWTMRYCRGTCAPYIWKDGAVYWQVDNAAIYYKDGDSGTFHNMQNVPFWLGTFESGGETWVNHSVYRFRDIDIPQGRTIQKVELELIEKQYSSGNTVVTKIYGNDVDDAVSPTSVAEYEALVKTSASVNWSINPATGYFNKIHRKDITQIIQEIVNRGGWSAGNSIQLMLSPHSDDGDSRIDITGWDGYVEKATILIRY